MLIHKLGLEGLLIGWHVPMKTSVLGTHAKNETAAIYPKGTCLDRISLARKPYYIRIIRIPERGIMVDIGEMAAVSFLLNVDIATSKAPSPRFLCFFVHMMMKCT